MPGKRSPSEFAEVRTQINKIAADVVSDIGGRMNWLGDLVRA